MDAADLGGGETFAEIVLAVVVHQEADGAAIHPVGRDLVIDKPVQRLQHQAVAAEGDDDIGVRRIGLAVAFDQRFAGLDRLWHVTRDEGDAFKLVFLFGHEWLCG